MSKSSRAAEAAAEQARLRALLAEQDARHAVVEAQDRAEHERMLNSFRQELARTRLEAQAQALEMPQAEVTPPAQEPVQPRDERTGRWLPAAPPEPEPEVDLANMSMADYVAMRSQLGVHDAPLAGPSSRPGYTSATNQGMFDGLPGYTDPRTANKRVFSATLADTRRDVPVGFQRPAASDQQHDEWR